MCSNIFSLTIFQQATNTYKYSFSPLPWVLPSRKHPFLRFGTGCTDGRCGGETCGGAQMHGMGLDLGFAPIFSAMVVNNQAGS